MLGAFAGRPGLLKLGHAARAKSADRQVIEPPTQGELT